MKVYPPKTPKPMTGAERKKAMLDAAEMIRRIQRFEQASRTSKFMCGGR